MKFESVPKRLFKTKYRKELWVNAKRIVRQLDNVIPIEHAYVMGSFTTKKKRPGDVDFIVLLQTSEKNKKAKWCVDLVIAPDNAYGKYVLADEDKWVRGRYGLKKSTIVRIK